MIVINSVIIKKKPDEFVTNINDAFEHLIEEEL